jgi:cytochrome c oxidase cbb3-type subunit 2
MSQSRTVSDSTRPPVEFHPTWREQAAAVVAVAATYGYFLIFAQFGFLKAVRAIVGEDGALLRPLMAVMGGCGIAGSIVVAKIFSEQRGRLVLLVGFGVGALAASVSMIVGTPAGLFVGAALTGLGTGVITVTLAGLLRCEVGSGKLGTCIGAGTGLAYGLCNLPPVFNAGATGQAAMAIGACAMGGLAGMGLTQRAPRSAAAAVDSRSGFLVSWVLVFFALVWLDSAAFYVIQHTPVLKGGTWGGGAQLSLNAIVHGTAALLAGQLLDRRWLGGTVLAAAGLLIIACLLIGVGPGMFSTGAFFYTTGVSFYSTALVFYVARNGRVGVAALVYSVSGWIGSALGIGMAENWGVVPGWILVAAGALMLGASIGRSRMSSGKS